MPTDGQTDRIRLIVFYFAFLRTLLKWSVSSPGCFHPVRRVPGIHCVIPERVSTFGEEKNFCPAEV